ncbi:hypothetical protein RB2501_02780 [Robiginitalea biformata HTCC2501]|uniref:Outer membrane protein beta-barrel domain-containing protein n=2 Tax=Flavobacteriaceae TaxID=49546 RepID=A4CPJ3_ROBBH|nr:hypothetical protein RB2501_02780 [Robiginitalea biformata HTCC2501]
MVSKIPIMRSLFFSILFLGIVATATSQQGFKIGAHGSLPVTSEVNDVVSLAVGVDAGYLAALGEVVDLGAMVGFINGFPEKFDSGGADLPSVQFLPLAGSLRIWLSNSFSFGGDAGYALGLNDGNDGGLYYKPVIGFLMGAQTEVNLSYTGIETDGSPWATVNLGFLYTFPEANRFR